MVSCRTRPAEFAVNVPASAALQDSFPWRTGQKFRLLPDSSEFFPAMLRAIEAATSHVLMEMYIMESGSIADKFITALVDAAQREVTVQLLLDDFGSHGLSRHDRRRLRGGGVQLAFYNPLRFTLLARKMKKNLRRTHRKFVIIDGRLAYVGGTGISDAFIGDAAWRDCMLEINGSGAADWQRLFTATIKRWADFPPPPPARDLVFDDGAFGRLVHTAGGARLPLKKILLNRIRGTRQRVWIASAYFIPSAKIRRALRRAAAQGRDVRLLLPGPVTDHPAVRHASRRYYARLLRHGVRVFEYQHRFMHSKVALADDWTTIGSSNLDRWNFRWNLEANQEVEDAALAGKVRDMLLKDFGNSNEITYRDWQQRSRLQRLRENLWGRLDRWLTS